MKRLLTLVLFITLIVFTGCSDESITTGSSSDGSTGEGLHGGGSSGGGEPTAPGVITAGEWSDLENWSFWDSLFINQEFSELRSYWSFYHYHRISVLIENSNSEPVCDAIVELTRNETVIWKSRTDNRGKAELWIDLFQKSDMADALNYSLTVNDLYTMTDVKLFSQDINKISIPAAHEANNRAEIAFVVDATGSMSDELEYLKTELKDVIRRVQETHSNSSVFTSAIYYRDEGDEFLTRLSAFSGDISTTLSFIGSQHASGGGDYPEAVHTALKRSVNELQWSASCKTRILFLLLDAPPHYTSSIINDIQGCIREASAKGIKLIPITASGIDKNTEFLMRFFAVSTNGTYVFITDDSGVGRPHLEPSVGHYEVEQLNDLMVRLIDEYMD